MLIRLLRNVPQGLALTGRLYVDSLISEEGHHQYQLSMDTLENLHYAIPDGFYRLRMTYSPRFQELLPLLDDVFGYYSGTQPLHNATQSLHNATQPPHNSTQPLNNATQPLHNSTQPLHNATQPLHNATQPLHNATESLHNSTQPLNNSTQPLHNATQPLHNATAHRTGIRIHAGNTIEHTTGCILVGDLACLENGGDAASTSLIASSPDRLLSSRKRLEELRNYLLNYIKQNPYEEIYIQLESPDPYPDADTACNYQQQQHIQESLKRAHQLREERR